MGVAATLPELSEWTLHDLSMLDRGVVRGPRCSQPDLFQLSRFWNSDTYFCKLDLTYGYYHLSLRPTDRHYFGFSFDRKYYAWKAFSIRVVPSTRLLSICHVGCG